MNKNRTDPNYKIIAENRRARYDYSIEDEIECGLSLVGSEEVLVSESDKAASFSVLSFLSLGGDSLSANPSNLFISILVVSSSLSLGGVDENSPGIELV